MNPSPSTMPDPTHAPAPSTASDAAARLPDTIDDTIAIDAAQPLFAGHFPGAPILPGVMQLAFAQRLLDRLDGGPWRLRRVGRCKFAAPVVPGMTVLARLVPLRVRDGGWLELRYELRDAGTADEAVLVRADLSAARA